MRYLSNICYIVFYRGRNYEHKNLIFYHKFPAKLTSLPKRIKKEADRLLLKEI
jgi:hypothetical protein